jgi:alpha-amylase
MLTQDDVLYMIVTDRFANGDPANDADVDRAAADRRHGGDLAGIVQRLPYLRDLGVTTVWPTPVYPNPPASYHGYHPLAFDGVDRRLCSPELGPAGGRETMRRFVELVHDAGLKVVFDAIVCHVAHGHPWTRERPHWFNADGVCEEKRSLFGLPDLNHDRIEVNVYFAKNLEEWLSLTGADGLRIDAARHVERPFWRALKTLVKGTCPATTMIGETWDGEPARVAPYQAVHGFDSMFDYPLYHAAVDVFARDAGFARLARPELGPDETPGVLDHDDQYRNANQLVTFLGNHDTPRFFRLAGGAQRPEEALTRTKLALTFLFTTRGMPQLYYGDELAMDGGSDPDNRRDMRWDLAADGAGPDTAEARRARELRTFVRRLIALRRSSLALRCGLLTTVYVTPTLYAFVRGFPHDTRLVVLNNAPAAADVSIPLEANPRLSRLACCRLGEGLRLVDELGGVPETKVAGGSARVRLPGRAAAVYRPQPPPAAADGR